MKIDFVDHLSADIYWALLIVESFTGVVIISKNILNAYQSTVPCVLPSDNDHIQGGSSTGAHTTWDLVLAN